MKYTYNNKTLADDITGYVFNYVVRPSIWKCMKANQRDYAVTGYASVANDLCVTMQIL